MAIAKSMMLEQVPSFAEGLRRGITDFAKPLKLTRLTFRSESIKAFQQKRSPEGQAWPSLKSTAARRGGSSDVLRDTGLLQASLAGTGKGNVDRMTPASLEWGTNLEYAATHQFGDPDRVPVEAKMLAIPLTPLAARFNPRKSPAFPGKLILIRSKKGSLLLVAADVTGRRTKAEKKQVGQPQYVLKKSVKIPARPFLGLSDQGIKEIEGHFARHLEEQAEKA